MDDTLATDEQLATLARGGDVAAFEGLVARFRDRLRERVRGRLPAILRARVSESDVVQECLLAAHRRLPTFEDRGTGSLGHWLEGIVDHKVGDQIRQHLGRARRDVGRDVRLPSGSHGIGFTDQAPSPSTRTVAQEEVSLTRAALQDLSGLHRDVLRLVHEAGLTVPEAAQYLERTVEATRKLYARAVASLAQAVGARGGNAS